MSDEDRDIDIESDDDDESVPDTGRTDLQFASQADKRAHHNALERKRRDHIKDSFYAMRDSVPSLAGEKVKSKASRAQILKKAAEYIISMRKQHIRNQNMIENLKKRNKLVESQVHALERAKSSRSFIDVAHSSAQINQLNKNMQTVKYEEESDSDSDSDLEIYSSPKRRKTEGLFS